MARRRFTVKSQIEKARRKRRALTVLLLLLLVLLLFFGVWILRHERFSVEAAKIENDTSVNDAVFEGLVQREIEGSYLFVIPKNSFFLFPRKEISEKIKEVSPEVASVEIKTKDFKEVTVLVENRVPYSIWCNLGNPNDCFFADKKAFIFKSSPGFSYDPFPVFGLNFTGSPLGKSFMEAGTYRNVLSFYDFLDDSGLSPSRVIVKKDSLSIELDEGALIIFEPENLEKTAQNIQALISPNEYGQEGFDFSQAEYVDLRYGNKVFWKPN